ncbi:hypothetical protein KQ300_12050 [Synechococcus sp. CS-1331]|uniref:hypothetical protein n=1 Tax=Synechococcus sp. CS-1331 TaxID=2847973 RepID=UPI0028806DA5|nr:hypothetical protein [Synechococcus sp. CS-1331]MCT0228916.1 hypothetical protein [Synechococcus sp. CS-1331]
MPRFLELAAGFRGGDPVVVTFYGGKDGSSGSHHLRWRGHAEGGGALPVVWDEALRQEVEERLLPELEEDRQLGFVAGVGGSKKAQITHLYGLRAEIDLEDSHELQRQVYAAVEERYGIRFTLLDTGGKSLHAWIASSTAIPVEQYSYTSKRWHALIVETAQKAGLDLPKGPDNACHGPTQVMRLPGAVHKKSRKVAEVIQWGEGPVALEALALAWSEVEEWAKRTEVPKTVAKQAFARKCEAGQFLGRSGDARIDELVSLARAVPIRVPGGGTYDTVLKLVGALSRALGAEEAAQVLHRAGHLDKEGRPSLEGLRQWCGTFDSDPEGAADHLGWLAVWAEREHGWHRPALGLEGVLQPSELVAPNSEAISEALFSGGPGLLVCRTGTGKSEGAFAYVNRLDENWAGAAREFSAVMITPRRTINSQSAQKLRAVNVSGRLTGKGDPFRQPGTQPNRYVCCLQSLGNPDKQNGHAAFWGEYQSLGDAGSTPVPTGRGVMAAVLILDEFRQILTDLLLSPSGPKTLWEEPAKRWRSGIALVRSIAHAGVVLAMDAQAGVPEQELLRGIGRVEAARVLGCPTVAPSRTMCWTSDQNRWRDCLLGHAKTRSATDRPLLVVTGAKGKEGKGQRGLSARALRDALLEAVPGVRVLIIDAESKDIKAAQQVLRGEVEGWDVVICTPVAQSGVSWVSAFAETVFVAGGRTLPPNICGGQAGRRERTATTCVAYVPKTEWDRSLPLYDQEEDKIRAELRKAREQAGDLAIAHGWEIVLLERVFVLAARRQIEELALFRDYTLHYAAVDGWATEELAPVKPLPRLKGSGGVREKRTEPVPYGELDQWHELLVRSLRLQANGAVCEVAQAQAEALAESNQAKVGSAGADLLSANLSEVLELLLSAGLGRLCDGERRAGDHELVRAVAEALQIPEAARVLRNAVWLQVDLKGTGAKPARTIGTVVRSLGGVSDAKKVGPRGAQQQLYRWVLPGER